MIDVDEFLWGFFIVSFVRDFVHGIRKVISMALSYDSSSSSPSSSSSSSSSSSPLSWMLFRSKVMVPKYAKLASDSQRLQNSSHDQAPRVGNLSCESHVKVSEGRNSMSEGYPQEGFTHAMQIQECKPKENLHSGNHEINPSGICLESKSHIEGNSSYNMYGHGNSDILTADQGTSFSSAEKIGGADISNKVRKRPARIIIPETCMGSTFGEVENRTKQDKEFEVEGRDFCVASKKGKREVMEDDYGAITDIFGDHKQALFAVFDGHGGRAAVDYAVKNLGKNIIKALGGIETADDRLEEAIRGGYLTTDKEFLSQGLSSGACAATVLFKDGELHVANVGDCRVVLSRNGVADALTNDHRLSREDERFRIESSGGYVYCRNGVWRVHGSLAISRAIGDLHLKEWIISEPEFKKLNLTSDCEFLIMASDGLWDKITDQEAVDVVLKHKNSMESCKKLVDLASSRGSRDDITVMLVNLEKFAGRND